MHKIIQMLKCKVSLLPTLVEMRLFLGILLCICCCTEADVSAFYKEYEVVPDIFDETDKIADEILTLTNDNGNVINGKVYDAKALYSTPTIQPPINNDPKAYYTMIYICPDWLSRDNPKLRHFLMWLVINIPGSDFSKGETIVEYSPAGPLRSKRPARYFFALYKQPAGGMTVDVPYLGNRETGIRPLWSIKDFVAKHNLGAPVGVLGVEVNNDGSVAQLHKEYMSSVKHVN